MIVQRKIWLLQEWRKTPTDSPTITVANVEKQNERRSSERGLARSAGQQRQSSGSSYFFKKAATLRRIQAAAAALWVIYGVAIHSAPVVVANLIVEIAAIYTSSRLALKGKAAADAKTGN
jgi:hypothetical protein